MLARWEDELFFRDQPHQHTRDNKQSQHIAVELTDMFGVEEGLHCHDPAMDDARPTISLWGIRSALIL